MRLYRLALGVGAAGACALAVCACEVYVVGARPPAASVYVPPPPRTAPPGPAPRPRVRRVAIAASTTADAGMSPGCFDPGAAVVGNCDSMKAAEATCASSPRLEQKCAAYKLYLDPKVAAAAVACVVALPSTESCDGAGASACERSALARACPDSALVQLCQVAATSCKITTTECTAMLSGLNDQGQQNVAQCVAQGCAAGLYACVESLGSMPGSSAFH